MLISIDSSSEFLMNSGYYTIDGMPYSKVAEKRDDGSRLLTLLVKFIGYLDPNFLFRGIQDKKFEQKVKELVKNKPVFSKFIKIVDMDFREFVETMVYALPKIFTYQFIKFVQVEYLGIDRSKKK